ncbi:integrase, partial [Pseudomonas syringae]|nr:integrase [Pseudomonas syringae]
HKHHMSFTAKQRGGQVGSNRMPHVFRRPLLTRVSEEFDLSITQKLAQQTHISTTASYDMRSDNERRNVVDGFDL